MKSSLRTRIMMTVVGITLVTTVIFIFTVRREASASIDRLENNNAMNLLRAICTGVQNQYQSIVFFRNQQLQQRKEELKNMVAVGNRVLEYEYELSQKGVLSEEAAQKQALDILRQMRYDNGIGYFWINNMDRPKSRMVMHPLMPEIENTTLDFPEFDCVVGTNENLLRAIERLCSKEGEGFIEYLWPKPQKVGLSSRITKLSYVQLFKPWQWVIGSGLYIEDIDAAEKKRIAAVIQELRNTSQTLKIGENGYIFLFSSKKEMLVHPVYHEMEAATIRNPLTNRVIMDEIMDEWQSGKKYCDYYWEKLNDPTHGKYLKRVYIDYFAPLDWYICVSYYLDDLQKPMVELNNRLLEISLVLLFIALGVAIVLSYNITAPLRRLTRAAENIHRNGIGSVEIPVVGSSETRELGMILNQAFTTIKNKENSLKTSEENLSTILRSIGDAVIATDIEGRIIECNMVASKLTGWDRNAARGRFILEVMKLMDPVSMEPINNPVGTVIESGDSPVMFNKLQLIARGGEHFLIDLNCSPIAGRDNRVIGTVIAFRDVTEKNRIEEELHQSQKMDSLGQLAGGIAHDFNNMLSAINSCAELIGYKLTPEQNKLQEYIKIIITTCRRAADLTSKLLAFSRKGKILSSPIDIHASIMDAVTILERSIDKRIKINLALNADNSTIIGDPSQIQNMVMNLGINAGYAMPGGGILSIRTDNIVLQQEEIEKQQLGLPEGPYLWISIEDTGVGISPDIIDRIFEPFFTTKAIGQGTGLGLAAVYGSVKEHRGTIKVWSEPDVGTIFSIYLPLAPEGKVAIAGEKIITSNISGHGCILLVDDENIIRVTSKALLENMGYEVLVAENGEKAIETYNKNRNQIDLVILDMVMPKMNGTDCFKVLKSINPDVKVLIASGYTGNEQINELKKIGLAGFIHKPFAAEEISHVLANLLDGAEK